MPPQPRPRRPRISTPRDPTGRHGPPARRYGQESPARPTSPAARPAPMNRHHFALIADPCGELPPSVFTQHQQGPQFRKLAECTKHHYLITDHGLLLAGALGRWDANRGSTATDSLVTANLRCCQGMLRRSLCRTRQARNDRAVCVPTWKYPRGILAFLSVLDRLHFGKCGPGQARLRAKIASAVHVAPGWLLITERTFVVHAGELRGRLRTQLPQCLTLSGTCPACEMRWFNVTSGEC